MKIYVAIDTSEWRSGDGDILRSIADNLDKKRDTAENSDAPTTQTIITQDAQEAQDTNAHDTQDEHTDLKRRGRKKKVSSPQDKAEESNLRKLLKAHRLDFSKSERGGSPSLNRIGARQAIKDNYHIMGDEEMNFFLDVMTPIWCEFEGKRWDAKIINEICAFIHRYYSNYKLDSSRLSSHLEGNLKGYSGPRITPTDFVSYIIEHDLKPGELTLKIYDYGSSYKLSEKRI